jgi:hypothetical protein
VHHAFRLVDQDSGRLLKETLEIHTLELGWYNLQESELETASLLDRWLYWLLHAHQYDAKKLATDSIERIAKKTEDKAMYDTREKAIRDQQWILNAARREGREEGEIKGEIKLIQTLQEILGGPVSDAAIFHGRSLEQLRAMTEELRKKIQRRT